MTRTLSLLSALMLVPAFAAAYGGNYGNNHCTPNQIRAGQCNKAGHKVAPPPAEGTSTLGTNENAGSGPAAPAAKGAATPMGGAGAPPGLPPGVDPAAAASAMSALKDTAPVNGKCPDGTTPVPGLNGASRCIPGNLTGGAPAAH
jgi:hypothetical protein